MSKKQLGTPLILLCMALILGIGVYRMMSGPEKIKREVRASAAERGEVPARFSSIVPGNLQCLKKDRPFPHYLLFGPDVKCAGILLESVSVAPEGGSMDSFSQSPFNLGVYLRTDGKVGGVVILETGDNPEFVQILKKDGFCERLKGKTADDIAEIDTVSGATMSSSALLDALYKTCLETASYLLSIQ